MTKKCKCGNGKCTGCGCCSRNVRSMYDNNLTAAVHQWYVSKYPDDDQAVGLRRGFTFMDVIDAINDGRDIYKVIGIGDSVIRERIMDEAAWRYEIDYSSIYNTWFDGTGKLIPNTRRMPERCWAELASGGTVEVQAYVNHPIPTQGPADFLNREHHIHDEEVAAMVMCSMHASWDRYGELVDEYRRHGIPETLEP